MREIQPWTPVQDVPIHPAQPLSSVSCGVDLRQRTTPKTPVRPSARSSSLSPDQTVTTRSSILRCQATPDRRISATLPSRLPPPTHSSATSSTTTAALSTPRDVLQHVLRNRTASFSTRTFTTRTGFPRVRCVTCTLRPTTVRTRQTPDRPIP